MTENKIHYPEDYVSGSDEVLEGWLAKRFGRPTHPVFVNYASRKECLVPANDLVHSQVRLKDGRLLRVDQLAPEAKGDLLREFVRTERQIQDRFYRTIVRVDVVNHDHLLLIIVGWSPWERVKRPLDVFGPTAEPPRDGDHYICKVNVGVEEADQLVFHYESKCPPPEILMMA